MWLTDLRIILPDGILERGALHIEGGTIVEIIEGSGPPRGLRLPGFTAMPGIVDLHGDMLERDIEPRPGARFPVELALYELDKRLAAAGVTTSFAAVSFAWTQNDLRSQANAQEIIAAIHAQREELLVDFRVHARFEITNPDTAPILKALLEAEQVDLVSVMDHTPGQGQYKNIPKYVNFMTRWLGFDPDLIGGDIINRIGNAMITSSAAPRDWTIIKEVADTALAHGIPVASHDDDTIEKVQQLKGLGISISEFPVSLEAAQEAKRLGMHVIMGAPNAYRGKSTSEGNLSARDAIKAGVVDILATDYFPAAPFQAALLLGASGDLPLHESVKLVTQYPAEAVGLSDRGQITTGRRADLVLYEEGLHPRIRGTMLAGTPIYWDAVMHKLAQNQQFALAGMRREQV